MIEMHAGIVEQEQIDEGRTVYVEQERLTDGSIVWNVLYRTVPGGSGSVRFGCISSMAARRLAAALATSVTWAEWLE